MTKEELIKRLDNACGCLIGSHTDNYTPQQQLESIIKELKQGQELPIHSVSNRLILERFEEEIEGHSLEIVKSILKDFINDC